METRGLDFAFTDGLGAVVVPKPSSLFLFATGAIGLIGYWPLLAEKTTVPVTTLARLFDSAQIQERTESIDTESS